MGIESSRENETEGEVDEETLFQDQPALKKGKQSELLCMVWETGDAKHKERSKYLRESWARPRNRFLSIQLFKFGGGDENGLSWMCGEMKFWFGFHFLPAIVCLVFL